MPASTDHPCFLQPSDAHVLVWRYMDFTKFVSLLESSSLFFCRADLFDDPFEGSIPKGNVIHRQDIYGQIPENQREKAIAQLVGYRKRVRSYTYINCWHMNEHESAAMWKLYSSSNEAIAISSKYSSLIAALDSEVYVGRVHYIDYETAVVPEDNTYSPFMFKRMSFSHEHEIRAVIQKSDKSSSLPVGITKAVDLDSLIQNVYVAPSAPGWYSQLVQEVISRYGLKLDVIQSSLSTEPVY